MTPAPTDAVLTDEEWEGKVITIAVYSDAVDSEPGAEKARAALKALRAHDAALRAKLAERDRLLRRVVAYLKYPCAGDNWNSIIDEAVTLTGGPDDA